VPASASAAGRLSSTQPHSYRADPAVPSFPDDKAVLVFDGVCVLCSGLAKFILRHDSAFAFRFVTAQSPLGQALMRHYGFDPEALETNLVISGGRARAKLDAVAEGGALLGWPWRAASVLRYLPRPLADWLYDRVAQNRYALFGRTDSCMIPPPDWRDRFIA
jgi:predicted DCC family thiol-disulfide oxidoreductase YuxK